MLRIEFLFTNIRHCWLVISLAWLAKQLTNLTEMLKNFPLMFLVMRLIRSLYYQLSFEKDDRYIDMCKDLINEIVVQDFWHFIIFLINLQYKIFLDFRVNDNIVQLLWHFT